MSGDQGLVTEIYKNDRINNKVKKHRVHENIKIIEDLL